MTRLQNRRPLGAHSAGLILIAAGLILLVVGLAIVRLFLWSSGVPAPEVVAISDVFDPETIAADRDFRQPVRVLAITSALVAPLIGLLWWALSGRIAAIASRLGRGRVVAGGALIGIGLALVVGLLRLPLGLAINGRLREGDVVRQSAADWARDAVIAIGIEAVIFGAVFALLALAIRLLPRAWPGAMALGIGVLVLGLTFAGPRVIQPLFEDTRPLEDPALVAEIEGLAAAAGVRVSEVVVNDAATRSRTFNARVEGIGATRRVVLFDTLVDEGDRGQLRWTIAHELAHEKHDHIPKGVAAFFVLLLPFVLLLAGIVAVFGGWGRERPDASTTLRRVSLAAGAVSVLLFLAMPIENGISRAYEIEADWTALMITDAPDEAIRARVESRRRARSDPDPPRLLHLWFSTHPTHLHRVGLAERSRLGT